MHLILPKCTLFFRNAPDSRKNAPCFQKCTRLSKKCTPLFQKCTLKNQKCTRAFSLGAFFYQNRCTKPTERQGYVPTQIIEKREILTVRVSLSHFYPTLIRQLPSHFCFKTLLWVLAQGPPLRIALRLPVGDGVLDVPQSFPLMEIGRILVLLRCRFAQAIPFRTPCRRDVREAVPYRHSFPLLVRNPPPSSRSPA